VAEKLEKSWQARIGEVTDAIAQQFVESMSYDWRLYKVDVAGSVAHATMLAKVKLIIDADRDAIVNVLPAKRSNQIILTPTTARHD